VRRLGVQEAREHVCVSARLEVKMRVNTDARAQTRVGDAPEHACVSARLEVKMRVNTDARAQTRSWRCA
jgi:hypothetical protein